MTTTVLDTPTHKIIVGGNPSDELVRKPEIERLWRDNELTKTDSMMATDRPDNNSILAHRQELRDYPAQSDFPNGLRPTL